MTTTDSLFIVSVLALFLSGLGLGSSIPLPETALAQMADPVLVGAGDITNCNRTKDEATAQLLDSIAGTVFTLGDNAYPDGTLTEFNNCYGPTWGRHKVRTKPSPGNHDYHTAGAAGYYTYFGTAASPLDTNCTSNCKGYYSYDLGAWHIIVLNNEIAYGAGSAQEQWLRADLASHQNVCTLAYWHRPRFSSGKHGNNSGVQPLWRTLYDYGADVVLNGHDHIYERFAPQNPSGEADPTRGIREFVVGTGGAGLYSISTIQANSEVRNDTTWGVLKLTLHPTSYDWEFIPVAGQTFTDSGTDNCGGTPSPSAIEVRVSASTDDAEEKANGGVDLTSSDLKLVFDGSNQTAGMRFNGIDIPQGATIANTYVQFRVDEVDTEATSLTIQGEDVDNATTFTSTNGSISSRPRTTAAASWSPPAWTTAGQAGPDQRTPNLASVMQEIVSRPGWASGNSLAIIITGSGKRTTEAFDGVSDVAPLLHVEYDTNKSPVTNPQPPSTLLPPGTTTLSLTVQSSENTTCAFSKGAAMPYDEMTPFDQGAGTTVHQTTLSNLNPDPNVVNNIYARCASQPDYVLQLKYRSLSQANPTYPRTGNLWGWWDLHDKGLPYMARIDLWLGAAHATADEIRELRLLNPDILILTNINAVDSADLPDDYYLKDIHGNRLEVWPNSYRLNLTKPYVAEYQAHYAYQRMLDKDLMFDGVFFDNVFTTQSWRKYDIYGEPFLVDADEDGVEDDPDAFDAAWKAGVFQELETFRALMPHAIMTGHGLNIYEPGIAEIFNGRSLGFQTADVLEAEMIFADLWDEYNAWHELARQPLVIMIESSPPDQIAYGYDYSPWDKIPPSTLEFARAYYPYVRFGLALTLMNDGYFTHEFGDTWHGNDWWYDELDFELGYPLGPAERIDLGIPPAENQIVNGGFEAEISDPWRFLVNETEGNMATVSRDTTDKAVGTASARIDVTAASGVSWRIKLAQYNRSLEQGVTYEVSFWAKSDIQRKITLSAQNGYGLWRHVYVDTGWKKYQISFEANETTNEARIQFLVGETSGTVWLDDVSMTVRPPDVYQRKFTNGLVLLNGSQEQQEITVGPGYQRLQGQQAPRYETILDDEEAIFSTTGAWISVKYDSGELQATGPFYHCWQETCHERSGSQGEARWALEIQAADTYTITAWWPAAPQADTWNQNVTYEVVVGEQVVASETFDQRSGGDEWHFVAEVPLSPNNPNYVRMYCQGEAPCLADALHLRSRARYNDGSPTGKVTLQPLDGIILARSNRSDVYLPLILKK